MSWLDPFGPLDDVVAVLGVAAMVLGTFFALVGSIRLGLRGQRAAAVCLALAVMLASTASLVAPMLVGLFETWYLTRYVPAPDGLWINWRTRLPPPIEIAAAWVVIGLAQALVGLGAFLVKPSV